MPARASTAAAFLNDPARRGWAEGWRPLGLDLVLYDRTCGLCHRVICFLLARDTSGRLFRYAPLREPEESVVVFTGAGGRLEHSDAVLYLLKRLGGIWRILARAAYFVPKPARNAVYALVSRWRHHLFKRPSSDVPSLPPHLLQRFSGPV